MRGRFSIVVPITGGGSWKCETMPGVSLGPRQIAAALRKYADYIDQYFVSADASSDAPMAAAATDDHP